MSEHFCKECKNDGDSICKFTGAIHTTGIECPSFGVKEKEIEMFEVGDRVIVVAGNVCRGDKGKIIDVRLNVCHIEVNDSSYWVYKKDIQLTEDCEKVDKTFTEASEPQRTFIDHPVDIPSIRTFESGATRDTTQGKLDYIKALSPIVLRRYV
ncbi:hypothetical protein LCGC14_3023660, partial [marine sediment metagenome]